MAQRTWSSRSAPRRDQRICCDLFMRRLIRKLAVPSVNAVPTPQPGPVPFTVVDQPIALPDEVAVQRLQRSPQLARGRDGSAAARLATEVMHHCADAIDADLRILDLAIPGPPAQALNLLDDHRLRGRALRTIGQQASGNLRQVLQPHGDVEPVEYRKPRDASVEKNAPQPETAIGKRRQRCALGPPDCIKAAAD